MPTPMAGVCGTRTVSPPPIRAAPATTAGACGIPTASRLQASRGLPWLATFRYPPDPSRILPYEEMTFVHVTEDHLRQLAEDRLPAGERQSVGRHLLTACPSCLELARKVLFPEHEQKPDYAGVRRRLELSAVLAWNDVAVETGVARALWEHHLGRLAPGPRLMAIRNNPDLHTWGMFDLLLTEAKRLSADKPLESLDLAYAALAVADLLSPAAYSEERIHDLRAGAWALLGNLKRLASDFAGAQEALRAAAEDMEKGTGDPYETINVLSMTASLVTDLGQLEDAADLLEEAAVLARSVRDRPLEGRLWIKQAGNISWVDPACGFKLAERGLRLLRRKEERGPAHRARRHPHPGRLRQRARGGRGGARHSGDLPLSLRLVSRPRHPGAPPPARCADLPQGGAPGRFRVPAPAARGPLRRAGHAVRPDPLHPGMGRIAGPPRPLRRSGRSHAADPFPDRALARARRRPPRLEDRPGVRPRADRSGSGLPGAVADRASKVVPGRGWGLVTEPHRLS